MPFLPGVHLLEPDIPVFVFEAPTPGPTALIQAGIHGDEVAGVLALEAWVREPPVLACGRLIVVPCMNPRAYRLGQRTDASGIDLNRSFPGDAASEHWEHRLARKFMDLVLDERPSLVATLHESHKRYDPAVRPSFGQTLVYGVEPMPGLVGRVVDALNRTSLASADENWCPQYFPVATSSTEVIVAASGCIGICVETWMGFALSRRVEMQRTVVDLCLADLGLLPAAPLREVDLRTRESIEAAAFRRLLTHLRGRTDVQNLDLMNLAGFCRNCLSKWLREAALDRGTSLSDPDARTYVYGMPYEDWKARFQTGPKRELPPS